MTTVAPQDLNELWRDTCPRTVRGRVSGSHKNFEVLSADVRRHVSADVSTFATLRNRSKLKWWPRTSQIFWYPEHEKVKTLDQVKQKKCDIGIFVEIEFENDVMEHHVKLINLQNAFSKGLS
jgi:hypothetical protein